MKNFTYSTHLLKVKSRAMFVGGIISYIAYTRLNYKFNTLEVGLPSKILSKNHFSYCSCRATEILKKEKTNFFTKAEINELTQLYLKYTQDIVKQSQEVLKD